MGARMARRFRPWTKIKRDWLRSQKRRRISADARVLFIDACLISDHQDTYDPGDLYLESWLPEHEGYARGRSRFHQKHAELISVGLVYPAPEGRFAIVNGVHVTGPPPDDHRMTTGYPTDDSDVKPAPPKDLPPETDPLDVDVDVEGEKTKSAKRVVDAKQETPISAESGPDGPPVPRHKDPAVIDSLWEAIRAHRVEKETANQLLRAALYELKRDDWSRLDVVLEKVGKWAALYAAGEGPTNPYGLMRFAAPPDSLRAAGDQAERAHYAAKGQPERVGSILGRALFGKVDPEPTPEADSKRRGRRVYQTLDEDRFPEPEEPL